MLSVLDEGLSFPKVRVLSEGGGYGVGGAWWEVD